MSTLTQVITRAREEWLQDTSASEWSPDRLTRHGNDAHRYLARRMARVRNSRWFTWEEEFQVAADAKTFDLTTLTKSFSAVRTLYHLPANAPPIKMEPAGEGEENFGVPASGGPSSAQVTPTYWLQQADAATRLLHIQPRAGGVRTFHLLYVYDPPVIVAGSTLLTPDVYDDLLAALLAKRAFDAEGEEDDRLDGFIANRMMDMQEDLATSHGESSGRRLRDATSSHDFAGGW